MEYNQTYAQVKQSYGKNTYPHSSQGTKKEKACCTTYLNFICFQMATKMKIFFIKLFMKFDGEFLNYFWAPSKKPIKPSKKACPCCGIKFQPTHKLNDHMGKKHNLIQARELRKKEPNAPHI